MSSAWTPERRARLSLSLRGGENGECEMKRLAVSLAALLWLCVRAFALDPTGEWLVADRDSRIRLGSCGGALCGVLVWTKQPARDVHNPDPAMRNRPLLG